MYASQEGQYDFSSSSDLLEDKVRGTITRLEEIHKVLPETKLVESKKILEEYAKIKKQNSSKNVVIGFGITEKTINSLKKADGLVVGSAICKEISNSINKRQNTVTNVTNIVKRLKNKIIWTGLQK